MSDADERRIARAYRDASRILGKAALSDQIVRALRGGSPADAVGLLPWERFAAEMEKVQPIIAQEVLAAGARAGGTVLRTNMSAFRFDRTDPRALAAAELQSGRLVTSVTDNTRVAVNRIVTRAFRDQVTVDQTARLLREVVGLTPGQAGAVQNTETRVYQQLVNDGHSDAFARRRARTLSQQQATRLHSQRAMSIARTEINRAQGAGRWMGWVQAEDAGLVDMDTYGKRWHALPDACAICSDNASASPVPAKHEWLHGGVMNPAHPNCRCSCTLIPPGYGGWSPPTSRTRMPAADADLVAY